MSSVIKRNKPLSKKHTARVENLLQDALTKHQTGHLHEAESGYHTILDKYPDYPQAKHLLGVVSFQLGNTEKAIALLEETLSIKPGFLDAQSNLGNIYFQTGMYESASAIFKTIIQQYPELASAYFNLGNVYIKQNKIHDAIENYQIAISLQTDYAEAHNNLGTVYLSLQDVEQALAHFEQAVKLAPEFADAYSNIGNCLRKMNRFDDAISYYYKAIKIKPDSVLAYHNLGDIFQALGQLENAINCYKQSLALDPNYLDSHFKLSRVLQDTGDIENAIPHLKKVLDLKPDHFDAHNNLGNIYYKKDRDDDAIREYKTALQINPDYAEAYNNLGNVLFEIGRIDDAIENYEKALQLNPNLSQARQHIAIIRPQEDQIKIIQDQLKTPELTDFDRMNYHIALGAIYNHTKSYLSSFEHINKGNQLKRKTLNYSADEHSEYINRLINIYSKEYFQCMNISGSDSECPVFIVGMPRSGTTLVEQILSSHPEITGAGELTKLNQTEKVINKLIDPNITYPQCMTSITKQVLENISHEYLELINSFSDKAIRICDKLPDNFLRIGFIKLLFPNASIIHCKRNALDTCTSIFLTFFNEGNYYSFDLEEIGRYYIDYERLMSHWLSLFPADILDVSYEELIGDQENISRQLVKHINLDWDDSCLNFYNNKRVVKTASNLQVRQPIYHSSVNRWKRYEEQLGPLIDILQHHQ
mgnify:CR=1 FL=1